MNKLSNKMKIQSLNRQNMLTFESSIVMSWELDAIAIQ